MRRQLHIPSRPEQKQSPVSDEESFIDEDGDTNDKISKRFGALLASHAITRVDTMVCN